MSNSSRTDADHYYLGLRVIMGICVAGITYLSWAILWVVGSAVLGLARLFEAHRLVTPAERFGAVWQWVVAVLAIALISTLLGAPRYSRLVGIAWFVGIAVLAVTGILLPVRSEPTLSPLFPVIPAAGLLVWIHLATRRAA
jgi:hypothetical protein